MALIQCPECGKELSDKARRCPHCGCPAKMSQQQFILALVAGLIALGFGLALFLMHPGPR